jgi:hypothetical protein
MVSITSPTATVYTNATVHFAVTSSGGAETLTLERDGLPLGALGASSTFDWDTTGVPEGKYSVSAVAQRGGDRVVSRPIVVTVDRTPPVAVTFAPTMSAAASLYAPIAITYSEALAPSSSMGIGLKSSDGTTVGATATLSADAKTVAVALATPASLTLPLSLTAGTTAAITDLAGNPAAATTWSWSYPAWFDYPPIAGGTPVVRVDGQSRAVVLTTSAPVSGLSTVRVDRTDGVGQSANLGTPPGGIGVAGSSLALDKADNVYVVETRYSDGGSTKGGMTFAQFAAAGWTAPFPSLTTDGLSQPGPELPSIAFDSQSRLLVSWVDFSSSSSTAKSIRLSRWSGAAFESLGSPADSATASQVFVLPDDVPAILSFDFYAVLARVLRYGGTPGQFSLFADNIRASSVPPLAVDGGNVFTAIVTAGTSVQVYRSSGTKWEEFGPALSSGAGGAVYDIALASAAGTVTAAWTEAEGNTSRVHVARSSGGAWDLSFGKQVMQTSGNTVGGSVAVAADRYGRPTVVWSETVGGGTQTWVRQSNR